MDISPRGMMRILDRHVEEHPEAERELAAAGRPHPKQVRALSTEEIVGRLRSLGVAFDEAAFAAGLRRLGSAEAVAAEWAPPAGRPAPPFARDFLLMAAMELHRRLAWEVVTAETLDDWLEAGYRKVRDAGNPAAAVADWLQAWKHLRPRLAEGTARYGDADRAVGGLRAAADWCGHLMGALGAAAQADEAMHERRIAVARELRATFGAEPGLAPRCLLAEADALASLGRMDEARPLFEGLVARHPRSVVARVALGDFHWRYRASARDHAAAETVYRGALEEPGLDAPGFVHARLAELCRATGRPDEADRHARAVPRDEDDELPANVRREGDRLVLETDKLPPLGDLIRKEFGVSCVREREDEFGMLLMGLEEAILDRYRQDRSLKNSHVLQALKETRERLPHCPSGALAAALHARLHLAAALRPQAFSDADIKGCLDRVAESVKWHGGKQGYLLFLTRALGHG